MSVCSLTKQFKQLWDEEPMPFGPVIDAWRGDDAFLPDEPHHLIRHGQFLHVPWLVGTNRHDGAFRVQGKSPVCSCFVASNLELY